MVLMIGLMTACGSHTATGSGDGAPKGVLATFVKEFDADAGHRRLVLLMSPT
jgi:hypothetical protein